MKDKQNIKRIQCSEDDPSQGWQMRCLKSGKPGRNMPMAQQTQALRTLNLFLTNEKY